MHRIFLRCIPGPETSVNWPLKTAAPTWVPIWGKEQVHEIAKRRTHATCLHSKDCRLRNSVVLAERARKRNLTTKTDVDLPKKTVLCSPLLQINTTQNHTKPKRQHHRSNASITGNNLPMPPTAATCCLPTNVGPPLVIVLAIVENFFLIQSPVAVLRVLFFLRFLDLLGLRLNLLSLGSSF